MKYFAARNNRVCPPRSIRRSQSWNFRETRYGHNKAAYKIIGCKVLRSRAGPQSGRAGGEGDGAEGEGNCVASLLGALRKSRSRLHDRKFLRIFYCVTIFMVIVIINLLGLFMPRARIKGGLRTTGEKGGGGRLEVGKGCVIPPASFAAFAGRSEITARKSERR